MACIRSAVLFSLLWAGAACGPETTSFRTTDKAGDPERPGPPAAGYDIRIAGKEVARVHVWSNGGYVSTNDEPSAHVGFEIRNRSAHPVVFDSDALELLPFDRASAALQPARFTTITPMGPAQIEVGPGQTTVLAAYFLLPVRPRAVDSMRIRWVLRSGDQQYHGLTSLVRNDDGPVLDAPHRADAAIPRS